MYFIKSDDGYYDQEVSLPPRKKDTIFRKIGISSTPKPYLFEDNFYSEIEMLRIIRMRAFL